MKIESLSAEQEHQLVEWRAKWLAIGLSTERADRQRTEVAIRAMYDALGKPAPEFIWCESPATGLLAAKVLTTTASLRASLQASLWASLRASLQASLWDSLRDSVGASLWDSLWASVGDSLWASVGDSLWASVGDSLWDGLWDSLRTIFWGQYDAYWIAYYRFAQEVLQVVCGQTESQKLRWWSDITESCGWWMPYEDVCICCERPTVQTVDDRGLIHGADGPAVAFSDGWQVWAWHGITVDRKIIEAPETLTASDALDENNAERRRVMIERMGYERFLATANAQLISEDRYGKILEVRDLPVRFVELTNRTPERDGSFKRYIEPIPREIQTAEQAAAWQWRYSLTDFKKMVEEKQWKES